MSVEPSVSVSLPEPCLHNHPPVRSVNRVFGERMTAGQRIADRFATVQATS